MDMKKYWKSILAFGILGAALIAITILSFMDFPFNYKAKNPKIHLYGETHGQAEYYQAELNEWKNYYTDGHRALFVELPYYTAEYLNLWMKAEDENILNELYKDLEGTLSHTQGYLDFLNNLKIACPETIFYGTDVGHQYATTGARYLAYLEEQGLKNSEQYHLAEICIKQGEEYKGKPATDAYREEKMVENFIAAYDRCSEKEIMGIYGSYHTDASYPNLMAGQLKAHYGDIVDGIYVINLIANSTKPFHFGFGYFGLIFLVMLFVPNIIWAKNQPQGYAKVAKNENKMLGILERIGEVAVTVLAVIFTDFNPKITALASGVIIPARIGFLVIAFVLMILYEIFWIRYFRSERKLSDFYRGIVGLPLAGATLPVMAFFILGVYGHNPAMVVATIILGIGHIGIHANHAKESQIV